MADTFKYLNRDGSTQEGQFEEFKNSDGNKLCGVNYIDGGTLRLMPIKSYDQTMTSFGRMQVRWQEHMKKIAKWEGTLPEDRARNKMSDPHKALSEGDKSSYKAAMADVGLDHSDKHLAAIRDDAFKGGAGRREKVYDVSGRAVVGSRMTPAIIAFYQGKNMDQVRGAAKDLARRQAQAKNGGSTPSDVLTGGQKQMPAGVPTATVAARAPGGGPMPATKVAAAPPRL